MTSPLGRIQIESDGDGITRLSVECDGELPHADIPERPSPLLDSAMAQLAEYFAGRRRSFALNLVLEGTPFQHAVWKALMAVPYGQATTYGRLGHTAGAGTAGRAVGGAIAANPLPILVPCHRVLAAHGHITGYSVGDGVRVKEWLLDHEHIEFRRSP
ncbi:methylated-DNA--[protein]-cysteine S-methyltransferase [Okibacterium endophyticum]